MLDSNCFVDISRSVPSFIMVSLSNSYTMGCPPGRGDNPRALASGLPYLQVDNHGITIYKPRTSV